MLVGNDGYLSAYKRQNEHLADVLFISLVLGVDGNGGITEHRFGTGGGDDEILIAVFEFILDVPKCALKLLMLDLCIAYRGSAARAPVDDAEAAVDKSLVIEIYEGLADCGGKVLVHGEALSRPVA